MRQTIAIALYPLEQAMLMPRAALDYLSQWVEDQGDLAARNQALEKNASAAAVLAQQFQGTLAENTQLRALLALRQREGIVTLAADILYETREPITLKVVIDRGSYHSVTTGMPVVDAKGLLGQVVRVFSLTSEVNLIADKDQATPVQVARNGIRAVAYGGMPGGMLELRYMAGNADIKEGDELYTSGIDGVYPPNLAVAKVISVDRATALGFAKIICQPVAGVTSNRHVAIITSKVNIPPPIEVLNADDKKRGKRKAAKP
jgi:rod shape-determining protein MreC